MRQIHFFKAYCGLGLQHLPNKQKESNDGVEQGPDAVLTPEFLSAYFPNAPIDSYTFPHPTSITTKDYLGAIASEYKKCTDLIVEKMQNGVTQIIVGGDHTTALSSMLALYARIKPQSIGYIQFDSHGDINTVSSSPSGNFHGMWLRSLVDNFDHPVINALAPQKLPAKNLLFVGNMDLDPGEAAFIKTHQIPIIDTIQLANHHPQVITMIKKWMNRFTHIHVSFDVDVFDASIVSATGTPWKSGIFPDHIWPMLEVLQTHRSISVDIVEVNPIKPNPEKTIEMAQTVILNFI